MTLQEWASSSKLALYLYQSIALASSSVAGDVPARVASHAADRRHNHRLCLRLRRLCGDGRQTSESCGSPSNIVIILGAAIGAFIIGNPAPVLKAVPAMLGTLVKGAEIQAGMLCRAARPCSTALYKLASSRRACSPIEQHIENPSQSTLFNAFPTFAANHHAVEFVCDYMRMVTMGARQRP